MHQLQRPCPAHRGASRGPLGRPQRARPNPDLDGLLSATALVHDLVLVTRNDPDIQGTGARLLDLTSPAGREIPSP